MRMSAAFNDAEDAQLQNVIEAFKAQVQALESARFVKMAQLI